MNIMFMLIDSYILFEFFRRNVFDARKCIVIKYIKWTCDYILVLRKIVSKKSSPTVRLNARRNKRLSVQSVLKMIKTVNRHNSTEHADYKRESTYMAATTEGHHTPD